MKFEAFEAAMLALPGVVMDIKWDTHRCFCIGEKMFVMAGDLGQAEPRYLFKASELGFEMLVDSGAAAPAPYLGRAKWVQMTGPDSLSDADVVAYATQAYRLIAGKLTKKVRAQLGVTD